MLDSAISAVLAARLLISSARAGSFFNDGQAKKGTRISADAGR